MQDITALKTLDPEMPGIEGLLAAISGGRPIGLRGAPRMTQTSAPITYWRESGASGENKLMFLLYHSMRDFDASVTYDQIRRELWAYTLDDLNLRLLKEPVPRSPRMPYVFEPIEVLFDTLRLREWGVCVREGSGGRDKFTGSLLLEGQVPLFVDNVENVRAGEVPPGATKYLMLEFFRSPQASTGVGAHPAPLQLRLFISTVSTRPKPRPSPIVWYGSDDERNVYEPSVIFHVGIVSYITDPSEDHRVYEDPPIPTLDLYVRLGDKTRIS